MTYFTRLPSSLGSGDLIAFRDAAIVYSAARRHGAVLRFEGGPDALDLLAWLGIEGIPTVVSDGNWSTFLDESRQGESSPVRVRRTLASGSALPMTSLADFRDQGYVAETMFAALIRSSYGPSSAEFFPTRSELGFYFDESLLLTGEARWDLGYLQACQSFFMEELTPAELVRKSLECLAEADRQALRPLSQRWQEELHGVTFLVAGELETLRPLADLLQALLSVDRACPGLANLVGGVKDWQHESWTEAWSSLSEEQRTALSLSLCPGFFDRAESILYTAGQRMLAWRAGAVREAVH